MSFYRIDLHSTDESGSPNRLIHVLIVHRMDAKRRANFLTRYIPHAGSLRPTSVVRSLSGLNSPHVSGRGAINAAWHQKYFPANDFYLVPLRF